MAIQQFGESLLSDIRKRNKQEAKRLRKEEEKQALLGLGVGVLGKIGNEMLANKMDTFLKNEQILVENAQFKAASKISDYWSNEYSTIKKSGKDAEEYYFETLRPVFEQQAKAEIKFEDVGDAGEYNSLINAEVRKLAKQRAETLNEAMDHVNKMDTPEEYNSRVALLAKKARPTNLLDYGIRKATGFFTGKSQAELEAEAIDALKNSSEALNADAMLAFQERYEETGNLVMSYDYAKLQGELDRRKAQDPNDPTIAVSSQAKLEIRDKTVYSYTIETRTNRNTGEIIDETIKDRKNEKGDVVAPFEITTNTTPEDLESIDLKSRITQFNFATDAKAALKPEAYTRFVKEVQDSTGILLSNIKTLAEYNKVSQLYTKYIDKDNLVDPINAAFQQKVFGEWTQNGLGVKMFLQAMSQDPNKKADYLNQTLNLIATGQDLAESLNTNKPAYIFRNSGN